MSNEQSRVRALTSVIWGREFFAPVSLGAVAMMVVNDHLLKTAFHNAITGKLSDFAICFFLPLVISALLQPAWPHRATRRLVSGALVASGLFVAQELSPTFDRWLAGGLGSVCTLLGMGVGGFTRDLTDLWALTAVPCGVLYGRHRLGPSGRATCAFIGLNLLKTGALALTALMLGATTNTEQKCYGPQQITFHVEGSCGPPGTIEIITRHPDRTLEVFGSALGPVRTGTVPCQSLVRLGGWSLDGQICAAGVRGDGGFGSGGDAPGTAADGGACVQANRRCEAKFEDAVLQVTCRDTKPGSAEMVGFCQAKLFGIAPSDAGQER